jgi:hypothetical protein
MALMAEDEVYVPKHHIVFHLIDKIAYQGNPRLYATWLDEALNKTLKACCRQISQATFEGSVLFHMRRLTSKDWRKRIST